ncbi:MAG: hypothetical protein R3B72_47665 [Polyangiaceae bacterium]
MSERFSPDQLQEGDEAFYYRNGNWTHRSGMCVSATQSQRLTMLFYEQNGRAPKREPDPPKPLRGGREDAKAQAIRAALAKALAKKSSQAL